MKEYVVPRFMGLVACPGPSRMALAPHILPPTDWTEFTAYTAETRPLWQRGKLTRFLITSPGKIWGAFVSHSGVKASDTSDFITLMPFSSDIEVTEDNLVIVRPRFQV